MEATGRPPSRPAFAAFVLLSLTAAIATALAGYRVVLSFFATYDDEGYFLISLREWLERGDLYDGVYSEYGPGYFVLFGGLFRLLGLEVDHDTGRMVTLALWVGASLVVGLALIRLTANPLIAVTGQLLAFVILFILRQDPLYPGGWLALLLVSICAAAAFLIPKRPAAGMFTLGALATTAALVKINVGGLALIAIAVACALAVPALRRIRSLERSAITLCIAVPFLLVAGELDRGVVLEYAATIAVALAAVVIAAPGLTHDRDLDLRHLAWLGAGIAAAAALVLGVAIVRGSGPAGLFEGIIAQPLNHREVIDLRLNLSTVGVLSVVAGLLGAIAARRGDWLANLGPRRELIGGACRISAGLWTWTMIGVIPLREITAFAAAGAFAWVAAMPPGDRALNPRAAFLRMLFPLLAVLNLLQAYPVGSNQLVLSVLPLVIVGGICLADGVRQLAPQLQGRTIALNLVIVLFALWVVFEPARTLVSPALKLYRDGTPLSLPGAERMRVPAGEAGSYPAVASVLRSRCGTFYSQPGLNSFYLWSRIEPPTGLNTGNWMYQFDDSEQREVLVEIDARPDICILRSQSLIDFWRSERPLPGGPLFDWIDENFEPTYRAGIYEVLERRARSGR